MNTFKNGNWVGGDVCPICKTDDDGEVILVPITGTEDGNIVQARQIHTKCLGDKLFYQPGLEYDFVGVVIPN